MIIVHACTLTIVHACTMTIVHAYSMIIVHACAMIIVRACTMIIMVKAHACTMIIIHVLCPSGLMFDEIEGGGVQGAKPPQGSREVLEGRKPPNS